MTYTVVKTRAEISYESVIRSCGNDIEWKELEKLPISKVCASKTVEHHSVWIILLSRECGDASAQQVATSMIAQKKITTSSWLVYSKVDKAGFSSSFNLRRRYGNHDPHTSHDWKLVMKSYTNFIEMYICRCWPVASYQRCFHEESSQNVTHFSRGCRLCALMTIWKKNCFSTS